MMPRQLRFAAAHLFAFMLLFATSIARSQTSATFDLPPQPLADSLRAVASATHTNIVFDADIVAGIQAPSLTGTATVEQALERLLAATTLRYYRVASDTIRVARRHDGDRAKRPPRSSASGLQLGTAGSDAVASVVNTLLDDRTDANAWQRKTRR